jgi:hypothetical protein
MTEEKSARHKQIDERRARVAALVPKQPRVRVTPKDDTIRGLIKHPSGVKFPAEGSVEWPLDSFTRRRIRDGDVTVEDAKEGHPKAARKEEPKPAEPKPAA